MTIPRAKWQLSTDNTVTLEGGFEPGHTYELAYLAENPPIAGLGFAAVRDAASWVKYAPDAVVSARYAFAFGSSQTGRWLRDFLYEGFNTDGRGRQVFDAVIPHKAGAGGVVLDMRWSTPTALLMEDGGAGAPLPLLVPAVDRDGNPLGGLRLPDVAVPLGTYTGWNFRKPSIGGTEQVFPLIGAYVPFAATKAERERTHDTRLSLEERYPSRDEYLKLVQQAGASLVTDGYLLADDLASVVKRAGEHWDLLVKRGVVTTHAER